MKQTLLVAAALILVLFTYSSSDAQIGIRAEAVFSKINGDDVFTKSLTTSNSTTNINFQTGYGAALTFQIPVSNVFSFQPEIHYIRRGYNVNTVYGSDSSVIQKTHVDGSLVTQYVDIPVFLKVNIGSPNKTHLFLMAGPYLGYAISGTLNSVSTGNQTVSSSSAFDFNSNNYNRFDYGVAGGLGIGIPIGNGTLTLDGRYNQGIGNLSRSYNSSAPTFTNGKSNNQWISVGLGYVFGF